MIRAIEIEWDGETLVVPESKAFELAEEIEEIVPLGEFADVVNRMQARKISHCYSIMLNFVGVPVTKEQVFTKMSANVKPPEVGIAAAFRDAIAGLAAVLTNGMDLSSTNSKGGDDTGKKPEGSSEPPTDTP